MTNARHRNKASSSQDSHTQAATTTSPATPNTPAGNDVGKKSQKPHKAPPAPPSSGILYKLFSLVFYVLLISVAAGSGWCVYTLQEQLALLNGKLQHLSEQKGELALTVNSLHTQVDILEKAVGRVEFISKDIQEKQQRHDLSIKNSEKELDVVGVVLKKLQKDLSNVIQDVKDQGDRDLDLFDKTMREKFTELNNSINDEIVELTEVQKSSQDEINNVKATLSSLGDVNSVTEELKKLKELFSELQASFKSKEETVDWLMNNAIHADSVTANSNTLAELQSQHEALKRDLQDHAAGVAELKEKLSSDDLSSVRVELDKVLNDFEQLSSSVSEIEKNYVAANKDLLKQVVAYRDAAEQRLKSVEGAVQAFNSETSSLESLTTSFEEYSRRLNSVEEAFAGVKHLSSGSSESAEALSALKEAQETLSQKVEELSSTITAVPKVSPDLEKLQVEVSSALEGHKQQIEDLKYDYDQWKNNLSNAGPSDQAPNDDLKASITKLESDLLRLREAVDSLVAYSVKIETHDKDLESVKDSVEILKESTDKLLVKFEQIQESV